MWRAVIILVLLATPAAPDDLSGPSPWLRFFSPNFELYTTAGEKNGRDAVRYFEQVRAFFVKASPVRPPSELPIRIVAFRNHEEYIAYAPVPNSGAYFTSGPARDYIVIADASPAGYPAAVHEFMHFMVSHSGLRLPLWLNEGWADVYSSMKPVRGGMAVGDLLPGRMQALNAAAGNLLDFDTLTSVTTKSPIYNEGDRTGIFYGESWALAHMLFLAPDYSDNFRKFLLALDRGNPAADACRIAYGKSSLQVFLDLQNYLTRRKMFGKVYETGPIDAQVLPRSSPVTPSDARIVLGDLLATLGRYDEARLQYQEVERVKPDSPELTQSLGYLALMRNDKAGALGYLEKAFAAGSSDPRMCLQLGLLARDAKRPPETVVSYFERALRSRPDWAEALLQLGFEDITLRRFEPAVKAFMGIQTVTPERAPPLFASLAYADLGAGDVENARKHLETAFKWARTPEAIKALENLKELLEARVRSPYPPQPGERLRTVGGTLQQIDCAPSQARLVIAAGSGPIAFAFPDSKAVEFAITNGKPGPQLHCGPAQPLPVRIEYAPVSVVEQGLAGVVRRLEY